MLCTIYIVVHTNCIYIYIEIFVCIYKNICIYIVNTSKRRDLCRRRSSNALGLVPRADSLRTIDLYTPLDDYEIICQ